MTFEEFESSLSDNAPPPAATEILKALWYDGKGDWETAHNIAQDIPTKDGSLIHAYLHRKEGDHGNASYWYHRAGRAVAKDDLSKEWKRLVEEFLK